MDVGCTQAFLQELPIVAENPDAAPHQGISTLLLCLHGIEEQKLYVIFRSAAQHFEGRGNLANLCWMGKREIPGSWVQICNFVRVSSFVAVIQFSNAMPDQSSLTRYLTVWMKNLHISDPTPCRSKNIGGNWANDE